jgi:hypothetical protein
MHAVPAVSKPTRESGESQREPLKGIVPSVSPAIDASGDAVLRPALHTWPLPFELLTHVIRHVQIDQGPFAAQALLHTSRQLRMLMDVDAVSSIHTLQRKIVACAVRCTNEILADGSPELRAEHCSALLGSIPNDLRILVVGRCLAIRHENEKASAISSLSGAMKHLNDTERGLIAKAALELSEQAARGVAFGGLGRNIDLLSDPERHEVIASIFALTDERHLTQPFAGLADQLSNLDTPQKDRLVEAALAMTDECSRATVITRLALRLASLRKAQHDQVVDAALACTWYIPLVIDGLAHSLELLSEQQHDRIVNAALALQDASERAWGIANLASGLEHLNPHHQNRLVEAAFQLLPQDKMVALNGLASGMTHLIEAWREPIFMDGLAVQDPGDRIDSICSLVAGMGGLNMTQREELVAAALESVRASEEGGGLIIDALAGTLAQLNTVQREEIFTACLGMTADWERGVAIIALCEVMPPLTTDLRERWVTALFHLTNAIEGSEAAANLENKANALASLMNASLALDRSCAPLRPE